MKKFAPVMLAMSLAVAGGVSWFASTHPDGLEKVAEDKGFIDRAKEPPHSVMPDYRVPGLSGFLSNGAAGVIGVLAVFGVATAAGYLVRRRNKSGNTDVPNRQDD